MLQAIASYRLQSLQFGLTGPPIVAPDDGGTMDAGAGAGAAAIPDGVA
ncbi:MAG: hypothetical protein WCP62_03785 [Planctomycetota bacterium]